MRPWMKVSLLIAVVVGLSWGGAIWYWRETNRMPAVGDMAIFFVAVPLGILASIWIGRTVMTRMAAAAAAPAASASPSAGAGAPPAPASPALAVLGAAISTPHGASADALTPKLLEGKATGELDSELVDDQGFPVMTVRSAEADDPATQEEITAWFLENGVEELEFDAEQWRALTMVTAVTAQLASQAASNLIPDEALPPMLYLQPLLPQTWDINLRGAVGVWLRHVVLEHGWPEKQLTVATAIAGDARGANPLAVFGRLGHQAATSGLPLVAIVVACDSHLSEVSIDKWATAKLLFSSSRPQGQMPGEGAAGVLLADQRQVTAMPDLAHTILHVEPEARRHNSADESKKVDATTLKTLTAKLLADTSTPAEKVGMLVSDTDHRSSRVLELMEVASAALPHLDASTDVLRAGPACGSCSNVPFLAAVALAHHHATELAAPVVCISNDDPYRRSAILIKPAAALS